MPRPRKSIEAALVSKGFERTESDHHYFVYVTRTGPKTRARTKTSHSPKVRDVADNLLGQMARQCLLTKPPFLDLVDCPLDRDGYDPLFVESGELDDT